MIICTTFAAIFIGFSLLQDDTTHMESLDQQVLSFAELPYQIQQFYIQEAKEREYREIFVSTNPSTDSLYFKKYTMENIYKLAKHGFVYEFYINGSIYSLKANKGDPFVFDNGYFFYTEELNLNQDNYKYSRYVKVKIYDKE